MENCFEYNKTVSINSLSELLATVPQNQTIGDNLVKAWTYINRPNYKSIACSISGGSDSDILLDICCRCDKSHKIQYFYFDTGIEYQATKDHIKYLEDKYGIEIKVYKAWQHGKTIPTSCKEYGQPFINKFASEMLYRLQKHNFDFSDRPYDELIKEYPNCINALQWWCNYHEKGSRFNIERNRWLKEFMVENPPKFKISNKCCQYAKKNVAHKAGIEINADLNIIGVRKAEGGIRSTSYKSCFSNNGSQDQYRPIFWYTDADKKCYEEHYGVKHSRCYTEYGLKRTGCVGCPYSRNLEEELEATRQNEPKLYNAVCNIFKDSYEYTRQYREFAKKMNEEQKKNKENYQLTIFDYL